MSVAYRMLLRLYPRGHRLEFADEMLGVFLRIAEERRKAGWFAYTRFVVNECFGLLGGAFSEWPSRGKFTAPLGGIALAAVFYGGLYVVLLKIHSQASAAVERSALAAADEMVQLVLLITACLVWLLFFVLLSMRLSPRRR